MSDSMTEETGISENAQTRGRISTEGGQSVSDRRRSHGRRTDKRHDRHSTSSLQGVDGVWGAVSKILPWKLKSPADPLAASMEQLETEHDAQARPSDKVLLSPAFVKENEGHIEDRMHPEDVEYLAQIEQINADYSRLMQESRTQIEHLKSKSNGYKRSIKEQNAQIHDQQQIIRRYEDAYAKLKDEHQQLKAIVVTKQENALQLMVANKGYTPKEDRLIRDELSRLGDKIRSWAKKHSMISFADLEGVAEIKKDMILNQLTGYCSQQDWNSMIRNISISRDKIPSVLMQACLAKDVFGIMFMDPFFAFAKAEGDRDLPTSREMEGVYKIMAIINESEAHIWRSQTLRNLSTPTDSNSEPFLQGRIKRLSSELATEFLTSSAQTLLRSVQKDGHARRTRELQSLYDGAGQLALSLWTQRAFMTCRSEQDLAPFTVADPMMSAHRLHLLDEDGLRDMIFDALKESEVLLSRKGISKYPKALQHLSSRHCDRHGQPLLADVDPEVYLSQSYDWNTHAENLTELGVTNLSYKNILDRLNPYLQGHSPKFLDPSFDDDWHVRLASLLVRALQQDAGRTTVTERIRKMALIPTSNGTLSSVWSSDVYFPNDRRGNIIPGDLEDIRVVQPNALRSESRQLLFKALGVAHCGPDKVVKSILKKYNKRHGVTLQGPVSHLSYLFRTLEKGDILDNRIFIFDETGKQIYRALVTFGAEIIKDDLYFGTEGEYGTKELCRKLRSGFSQQSGSGSELHIIHSAYINAVPLGTVSQGRTWQQWLEEVASVRRTPRIKHFRTDRLSTLSQQLADDHPMVLIGILKSYWGSCQAELTPGVTQALKDMKVPCGNQSKRALQSTFFPSKEMRQLCSAAGVEGIFGHFLDIPIDLASDEQVEWEFLATLGVGLNPDVRFFYNIFASIRSEAGCSIVTQAAFFRIYRELAIRFPDGSKDLNNIFEEWAAVCIPTSSEETPKTAYLSDCVWNGHSSLRRKHPLGFHSEYSEDPHVAYLFNKILRLPDASLDTYLEELKWYKGNSDVVLEDLRIIYDNISQNLQKPNDHIVVMDIFIEQNLVYLPAERAWLSPESCVWADAPKIGGQYGIRTVYLELESFFRNTLKVQTPTAANYIEQLRKLVSNDVVDIVQVKAAIKNLEMLGPSRDELEVLSHMRFLPVEMPSGNIEILKPTDTFFLADRIEYLSAFRGKVPILNYSLEEGRRMYKFLRDIGLEDRYMSMVVQEQTVVRQPSDEPSSSETRTFRSKARYIYRCILHYKAEHGENDEEILRQLQDSVVYESAGFEKSLVLQLNEVTARVQSDTGSVHIVGINGVLHIYIPRNPENRQRCYSVSLPQALRRHFGLKDSEASFALKLVFVTPASLIDESLDDNGIVQIHSDNSQQSESESTDTPSSESHAEEDFVEGEIDIFSGSEETQEIGQDLLTPLSGSEVTIEVPRTLVTHHQSSSPAPQPFTVPRSARVSPSRDPIVRPQQSPYTQLLDKVIRLARLFTLSEASQRPQSNVSGNENILHESVFGVRSENQLAHDIRIGAAGELFVFELLLAQGLPEFSRSNWRSNIRMNVSVHPDYHDLTPWRGVETADLVYRDTGSVLTTILINAGYFPYSRWHDASPTYYIEVKATTGERDSAFFVSKSQYRRMQRMRIEPAEQAVPEIYVIFRVYQLGKENMGLEVYVDPESLRQEQRLIFTPESYSVCPGLT